MLIFTLLAPLLFLPCTLALTLSLNDTQPISPNTNVHIHWAREPVDGTGPLHFTLSLTTPDGTMMTRNTVSAEANENNGTEKMTVGPPGSYFVRAASVDQHPVQSSPFPIIVVDPATLTSTSSSSVTTTATGSSTSSSTETTSNSTSNSNTTTRTTSIKTSSSTNASTTSTDSTTSTNLTSTGTLPSDTISSTLFSPTVLPTSPPTPSSSFSESASSSPNRGVVIGSVLGGLAALAILIVILFLLRKRRKQRDHLPVTFHRDLMVRTPGPALFPLSHESDEHGTSPTSREKETYLMVPMDTTTTATVSGSHDDSVDLDHASETASTTHMRKKSNPFRDEELMSRFSRRFDDPGAITPPAVPEIPQALARHNHDGPFGTLIDIQ